MDVYRIYFGTRLKDALDRSGQKQAKLAAHLKVKPSTVSRWASGKDFPEDWRLPIIAKFLSVTVDELTGTGMSKEHTIPSHPEKLWDEALKALKVYSQASNVRRLAALYLLSNDQVYLEEIRSLPDPDAAPLAQAISKLPKAQ